MELPLEMPIEAVAGLNLETELLILHIEGEDKAQVLDKALGVGPAADMPVRAVLRADVKLSIYWCP